MAGCCGGGGEVTTSEICGFLADRPELPSCVQPTDEVVVLRGSVCYTMPACEFSPRYRLVA
jgi:hypothetical protein